MSKLDDLKERLSSEWAQTLARLEDNSLYVTLRDRYQSQSPLVQKLLAGLGVLMFFLIVMLTPYGWYETSVENVTKFDETRGTLKDLVRVKTETRGLREIPAPPSIETLRSRIEGELASGQLTPEQYVNAVTIRPPFEEGRIKAQNNLGLLVVELKNLNLRQVLDFGYSLQNLSPSVKLKDLSMQASQPAGISAAGYFNVAYHLLVLKVSSQDEEPVTPPNSKGAPRR